MGEEVGDGRGLPCCCSGSLASSVAIGIAFANFPLFCSEANTRNLLFTLKCSFKSGVKSLPSS